VSDEGQVPETTTCCALRRKIVVGVLAVLNEEQCGVSDVELADVIVHGMNAPSGKPVIAFLYCPWCGKRRGPNDEVRVIDPYLDEDEDDEGESWKNGGRDEP